MPFFLSMSIVSNSALGLGGSDSRGSIRKPLVEWEVVPIVDSLSEEVPREVFDNSYSSFERLMDLGNVDEGSSGLRMGTESLEDQTSPVTTIVPYPS